MTTLNNISITVKNHLWLFVLIPTSLLLILLIIWRYTAFGFLFEPNLPAIDKPHFDSAPTTVGQFTFSLDQNPKGINKLPLYKQNSTNSFLANSDDIAKKLGFSAKAIPLNDVKLGQGFAYSSFGGSLVIYKDSIAYSKSLTNGRTIVKATDEFKRRALDYFKNLGLPTENLSEVNTRYLTMSGFDLTDTSQEKASYVNFDFSQNLSGFKVISPTAETSSTLDASGEVIRFRYKNFLTESQKVDYPLISANEARNIFIKNGGNLIKTTGGSYLDYFNQVPQALVKEMYIAYLLPEKGAESIQPVWVISTQSRIKDKTVTLSFAIPAVKDKYFKKS